ncbi:endonuclease/exonuclease/phosphatase family protein [Nocardioidaceae bacterium Broad-1]|nr:endonuclease/exonuclease/phosphatase family protein [Nocardioidaceae bacterium Broad-1]
MRIVSVNAWGGARYDDLAAWLPTAGADVVCLQEVTRTAGLSGWTSFADGERSLPQRANLHGDVRRLLPSYEGPVSSPAMPARLTDDAGRRHRQDFGLGTYVRRAAARHRHGGARSCTAGFVDHDEWTNHRPLPSGPRAVRVVDRAGGRQVCVLQLHGLRDPAGKGDTPARREQAERLAAFVEATRAPGDLVVVAGDLNLLPDSATFDVLRRIGLQDLVGTADTRTSSYLKPVRHASYLLVSDPEAVAGFRVRTEPEVSDHRILELDLTPAG